MTVMTAGTGGFGGDAAATGPNAGYDPVMKFRGKIKKKDAKKLVAPGNKLGESRENPKAPSRLFQYKVTIPEVGETVIYASSPAELQRKLRMVIMPAHRGDISIERMMPAAAGKFFMNKRMNHMRNVQEQNDQQMKQQMAQQKIAIEKKKIMMKKQELQKQLQLKTQQLKKQARAGAEQDATR
jgi:hypothetical protein|tara:strand:+ start:207 stop:755 length:549 start_codon:yes stop_codon:yes gene_type:complete